MELADCFWSKVHTPTPWPVKTPWLWCGCFLRLSQRCDPVPQLLSQEMGNSVNKNITKISLIWKVSWSDFGVRFIPFSHLIAHKTWNPKWFVQQKIPKASQLSVFFWREKDSVGMRVRHRRPVRCSLDGIEMHQTMRFFNKNNGMKDMDWYGMNWNEWYVQTQKFDV